MAACSSANEMFARFHDGVKQKIMATHNLNAASSRSHCIYTLYVESMDPANPDDVIKAKLSLVDLAGSERVVKTGATGVTLQESIGINKSLFVLRQVIQTLSDESTKPTGDAKLAHVPYRDSKLTALLKHSLGGNSITLMIACLSPCDAYVDENVSTLVYAAKAQAISNKPVKNEDPKIQLIQKLRAEIASLKAQLAQAQQVILHMGELGAAQEGSNDKTVPDKRGAPPASHDNDLTSIQPPTATQASETPGHCIPRPPPNNQTEAAIPPLPPSVSSVAPPAALIAAGDKQLKLNVIDNVQFIKSIYENERHLRSEVDTVTQAMNALRTENRCLNLENQSLRERIEVLEYLVVGKGPEDDCVVDLVPPRQDRIDDVMRRCMKPIRSQGALRPATTQEAAPTATNASEKKRETGMLSISELRHLLHNKSDDKGSKKRSRVAPPPQPVAPHRAPPVVEHPVAALLTTLETQGNNSALEQDSLQSLSELNRLLKVKAALKHASNSR
ncbi:hypothetical protein, variant [Aphanomyces invadans]|nr:hypothetical protein, variant [Aphanomyces invadans]ETW01242.1 hypothetical protein, variant [Aphanomyces invadans]|eukprot:XP_008870240.1 hypothetical protein, variant [Aphanomyces invadans]